MEKEKAINDFKAAAIAKGIPEKYLDKHAKFYTSADNFDQETALDAIGTDWADIKEFALTGKITDKGAAAQIEKDARTASIRKLMQEEAEKLIDDGTEVSSQSSKSELQDFVDKLING